MISHPEIDYLELVFCDTTSVIIPSTQLIHFFADKIETRIQINRGIYDEQIIADKILIKYIPSEVDSDNYQISGACLMGIAQIHMFTPHSDNSYKVIYPTWGESDSGTPFDNAFQRMSYEEDVITVSISHPRYWFDAC